MCDFLEKGTMMIQGRREVGICRISEGDPWHNFKQGDPSAIRNQRVFHRSSKYNCAELSSLVEINFLQFSLGDNR